MSDAFHQIDLPVMPIKTVLLNLLSNAIKHHDKDRGRIVLDVQLRSDSYVFSVTDDGPGIAPKYHKKIFEMFQTLKPRDTVEASGIGLAMVRKQVDQVGGSLTLESELNNGSTFRVFWPTSPEFYIPSKRIAP